MNPSWHFCNWNLKNNLVQGILFEICFLLFFLPRWGYPTGFAKNQNFTRSTTNRRHRIVSELSEAVSDTAWIAETCFANFRNHLLPLRWPGFFAQNAGL